MGLPVAAYVAAAWLEGRDAGLVAGLVGIWLTVAIRKVATVCAQPADDFRGGAHGQSAGALPSARTRVGRNCAGITCPVVNTAHHRARSSP